MMPDMRYLKVVFDDGSELDLHQRGMNPITEGNKEARKRKTRIAYILRGQDQYTWPHEFIPMQYFNAKGIEEEYQLLAVLIKRGLQSRNPHTVAVSAFALNHIVDEAKKEKNK